MMPRPMRAMSRPRVRVTHQVPKIKREGSRAELRKAMGTPISVQKKATPRNIHRPRVMARPGEPACWVRVMTLVGMTGGTQGVRFMSAPPRMATSMRMERPNAWVGSGSAMPKMERVGLAGAALTALGGGGADVLSGLSCWKRGDRGGGAGRAWEA